MFPLILQKGSDNKERLLLIKDLACLELNDVLEQLTHLSLSLDNLHVRQFSHLLSS